MKIMYITFIEANSSEMYGVQKKVQGQIDAFAKCFDTCYYTYIDSEGLIIYKGRKEIRKIFFKKIVSKKISRRFSFYNDLLKFIMEKDVKFLYIRYRLIDPFFVQFLKKCKRVGLRVYIELPTYPYEKEISSRILFKIDNYFFRKLHKYVENIVTYSDDKQIFGIKTISIGNGIDIKTIKLTKQNNIGNKMHLIAVANVSYWHGYDRLIKGLNEYYDNSEDLNKKNKVYFHIVGDGLEIDNLKLLTKELDLSEYIVFHGAKSGKELDEIFDYCHLGIGSLANHRKGIYKDSALKNREYCSRGLPFIIASEDNDFPESFKFVLRVAADNFPINVDEVLKFYDEIAKEEYKKAMRVYAEENLTWDAKMKDVINSMKEKFV